MPHKKMERKHCEIDGCKHPEYGYKKRHMQDYHPNLLEESGGSSSIPQKSPDSDGIPFQSVDKVMKRIKTQDNKQTTQITTPSKKGGGTILGIGRFFITISEWLNKTICKDPKIEMDEKIAASLEKQFNDAFGAYITPLIGLGMSVFWIFGVPILLNVFGKEIMEKIITKFSEGFKNKIDGVVADG